MFFSGGTEATEGLPLARLGPRYGLWDENTKWEWHILDILRVPVILDPALLDFINDSPTTSGFTLQSKVDILYNQLSDLQTSGGKHTR
jgi:hypothetical protein